MDIECLYSETVPCPDGPISAIWQGELTPSAKKNLKSLRFFFKAIELQNSELKYQVITKGTMFVS